MRASVLVDDPSFREEALSFAVTVNGEVVEDWLTADEELGECVLLAGSDDAGHYVLSMLRGEVRIIILAAPQE